MKLIYIANMRLPTEKAHGIQIMNMCAAFANLGLKVELVVPRRLNPIKEDPFKYYDIKENFKITKLRCLDLVKLGKIGFLIQIITFLRSAKKYLSEEKQDSDILYTREILAGLFFKDFFLEIHTLPKKPTFFHKKMWQKAKSLIVLTPYIEDGLIKAGIKNKILVAPDATDLTKFDIQIQKKEAREELMKRNPKVSLPEDKKIVLYAGSFHDWKGVDSLLSSPPEIKDVSFVFVGELIETFNIKKFSNQTNVFVGFRPHQEIPLWLKAADILILPNSEKSEISRLYTSPMKLFEYMASGTPIVAFDIPSIREVLNEKNAFLANPDSVASFSARIQEALKNKDLSVKIAEQARLDVQQYTWEKRAQKIYETCFNFH